jgi:hypothetical protein
MTSARPHLGRSSSRPVRVDRGGEPRTQWLPTAIQLEHGYIRTGRDVNRNDPAVSRRPLDRAPLPRRRLACPLSATPLPLNEASGRSRR